MVYPRIATIFAAGVLALSIAPGLIAQEVTAGIYGVVQDSTSAVIPNVVVRARNTGTGIVRETKSDESGNYLFTLIPIGTYEVTAEAQGFKKATVQSVILRVNDNRRIIFSMEVGQIADQVTVEAAAVAVNTATGTTSQLIDGKDMIQLPSRGRNVVPFALLMPGVVSTTPYDRRANNSAVNGIRPTHNAWLLDGGYNVDTGGNWSSPMAPNIETVAEFRAIRGNYSAEFGVGGGSQFNVITKGGTNALHGSVYYFHRNDKLNARNFFLPSRAPFRGNDFGFSVGGPAYIPKVYNGKNKTFFFVLLGWIKERRQESFFNIVPTPAQKAGNFSASTLTLFDPDAAGQPFPGNVIPQARIDRNALGYARMYPDPNFLDAANRNSFFLQGRKDNTDEMNFRVDHNFTNNHRIMWRLTPEFRLSNFATSSGFSFLRRQDETPARNMTVNYNATFRPNLIMDFNWVRSHNRIKQFPPDLSGSVWGINIPQLFPDTEQTYPLQSLNLSKVPDRVPTISLTNYAGVTPGSPWSNYQTIYEFRDSFTWIKNRHTIKFGGNYSYEIKFEPTNTDVFGRFTFDGRATRQAGVTSGDAFADMLLGRAATYDETNTVAFNDNRRNSFEAFVDDSWKVNTRLTLNLGVRFSYFPPAHEPDNRLRAFVPGQYNAARAVTVNSSGQVVRGSGERFNGLVDPTAYWQTHKKNFAPRFSFAYDLFGNGKTAVRGGYGLFYSREILGAFILMSGNPPFSELVSIDNTRLSAPGGGSSRNFDLPIGLGSIDMNQLTPYTQQWNLNIQHGLGRNTVVEIGYSGSRGIHFMRGQDLNQPLPNPLILQAGSGVNVNQLRPYKGWTSIMHREQSYASNYHGLQTSINRNFANGLMFQTAYTWSKAIDNADYTGGIYGNYPNTLDASGERALASFDARHNFVGSMVYELPFLKGRKDLASRMFGGWQVGTIYTLRTGLPISPELGRDVAAIGSSTRQRPLASGRPQLSHSERTLNRWFDASVYSLPATGTFSPVSRNVVGGPGWNQWDMNFMKAFPLKEGVRMELRGEGYNFFNHTQFNGVGTNFSTPATFGRVTSTRNERNFMLGARIQF